MRKGERWGSPEDAPPDLVVVGGDTDLSRALLGTAAGVLVSFVASPESDVARAVGLRAGAPQQGLALPMDALELGDGTVAVNAVVLGPPPDRLTALRPLLRAGDIALRLDGRDEVVNDATTVVVATGQWLRGLDLVPRGHPGDGRAEVQAYRLRRNERRAMRARLPTGTHLPHPRIVTRTAVEIEVRARRPLALEIDGRSADRAPTLRARVVPARYRLLI
jgi:hypothetical protein